MQALIAWDSCAVFDGSGRVEPSKRRATASRFSRGSALGLVGEMKHFSRGQC